MAKSDPGNFARDFGYLMPFLERVQAAGEALPPPTRNELATLLAGERARWERIRELLAGAEAPRPGPAPPRRVSPTQPPAAVGFTVGSLRTPDS
jgi:hypothetical protein